MSYRSDAYFRQQRMFSQLISKKDEGKFLTLTACMDKPERQIMAYMQAYIIFEENYDDNMSLSDFIKKIAQPIIKLIGEANFWRSELTHLGFKAGIESQEITYEEKSESEIEDQ